MTDDGLLLVAFFAEYPDGKVVDGNLLADVVEDNLDEISAAVSCIIICPFLSLPSTPLQFVYNDIMLVSLVPPCTLSVYKVTY